LSDQSRDVINKLNLGPDVEKVASTRDLKDLMNHLYNQGYLLASYNLVEKDDSTTVIDINTGQTFRWLRLNRGNLPEEFGRRAGLRLEQYEDNEVNYIKVSALFQRILDYAENTGYPFASIQLDAVHIDMDRKALSAKLKYKSGPLLFFDSLVVKGTRTNPSFLTAYLGFSKGDIYNQKKNNTIAYKISKLGYVEFTDPPEISFRDSTYTIILSLKDKPSSTFNGLVGFFPNENERGKILVTGMINLGLKNLFNSGKEFRFDWNKPNIQTQELNIDYIHPNLFKSVIGMSLSFDLYKQDSTFLNRGGILEFSFQGINKGTFGLQASFCASDLLGSDPLKELDRLADYNISYYGLNYKYSNYDDWILPRKGWDINGHVDIGSKNIKSDTIFESDENSIDVNIQSMILASIGKYFPVKKRSTIHTRFSSGHITNSNLLWNELYRLGGIQSIRGFNEKFFYASSYAFVNIEYRLFFDNESQMMFFYDQGVLRNLLQENAQWDYPFGLGAGFNLKTNFGILTLLYALGSSDEKPFGLNYSKIHMGYTSRF
jgi:outer membrane translocation and assembly module TamA